MPTTVTSREPICRLCNLVSLLRVLTPLEGSLTFVKLQPEITELHSRGGAQVTRAGLGSRDGEGGSRGRAIVVGRETPRGGRAGVY